MEYSQFISLMRFNLSGIYNSDSAAIFIEFTRGELKILDYISMSRRDYVLPGELSSALKLSSARIAAALNSLEKKKYISRTMAPGDRRKILVALTDEGNTYIKEKRRKLKAALSSLAKKLGKKDSEELVRILSRINDIPEHTGKRKAEPGSYSDISGGML
ncbi:MarR family winged helix-turn-helix transcriptional regulator [Brucepastera parasyntrophica]|uniref:MarR family winged helix-turn-helix transcriptional regulator n=1 Tax=Brucepastera parasyntrophica TaxID=2880008 RepID=UPI00210E745B|nr:MarR family winged helix-turn-helix transcriptional regulator [Brucepastera parasyntrophica]ULQ59251.1 MarR family winged helix-turn-helix transcriptional regulator [Brucepastera parasyntrophica]